MEEVKSYIDEHHPYWSDKVIIRDEYDVSGGADSAKGIFTIRTLGNYIGRDDRPPLAIKIDGGRLLPFGADDDWLDV